MPADDGDVPNDPDVPPDAEAAVGDAEGAAAADVDELDLPISIGESSPCSWSTGLTVVPPPQLLGFTPALEKALPNHVVSILSWYISSLFC